MGWGPIIGVGALAGLGLLGWALGARLIADLGADVAARGTCARPPVAVEVAAVQRGPIRQRLRLSGSLVAEAAVAIAPQVDGRLIAVTVDLGATVAAGAELARIEERDYAQALASAAAALTSAQARVAAARSTLAVIRRQSDRIADLATQGVASADEQDRADADLVAAESAQKVAEAEAAEAATRVQGARIDLSRCTIRAPENAAGTWVVADRLVDPGGTVASGDPLLHLLVVNPLRARIPVDEGLYARLAVGQEARLQCAAVPGRDFPAQVARRSPVFDPSSRQALVELTVPNPEGLLRPGLFVQAQLVLDQVAMAVLVPEAAICRRQGATVLYQVQDDGARVREVAIETGLRDAGLVQVRAPAELSGRVVTLGQQLLTDGSPIVIPVADAQL